MDLKEVGVNTRNWVDSAQARGYWRAYMNVALNLRVPYDIELIILISPSRAFDHVSLLQ